MKNFEFLKDFDRDMYTLLSEFEMEAVKKSKNSRVIYYSFFGKGSK